jgi:hypothetical protein
MIERLVERVLFWALNLFIKKEEPKMLSASIPIGDKLVPLSAFSSLLSLLPKVEEGILAGKSASQILEDLKPVLLPDAEAAAVTVIGIFFPEVGGILGVLDWMISHNVSQTQEQVNAWMDRTTAMGGG